MLVFIPSSSSVLAYITNLQTVNVQALPVWTTRSLVRFFVSSSAEGQFNLHSCGCKSNTAS